MPFLISPSRFNGQPGFMFDWKAELRCFYDDGLYTWIIVDEEHPTPVVMDGDRELHLRDFLYNGEPVWGGYGILFNSVTDGWIYNPRGLVEPHAEKDLDGTTWIGDGWWKAGKPSGQYPEIVCEPKGTSLNEGEGGDPPYQGEDREPLILFAKQYLREHPDIDYFIFGHRHIELDLALSRQTRVIILGDWITQFTYAVYDGEQLYLENYAEGEDH